MGHCCQGIKMKKVTLFGIIGFTIIVANNISPQGTAGEYWKNKMREFFNSRMRVEGNFKFMVVPTPAEWLIVFTYPQWEEKRYTYKEKVKEARNFKKEGEKNIYAVLVISFIGDWDSKGETSKKIPEDIADYIFLENDKGKFVRCSNAEVPLFGGTINAFNKTFTTPLEFPSKFPDTKESIFAYTEKVKFVIGGLGFKNNEFEYKVPFSNLFSDAPPEIKEIYYDIGLWKRPEH